MNTNMLKVGVIVLWLTPTLSAQEEPKPEELTPSQRKQLQEKAAKLNKQIFQLYGQGRARDALKLAKEVLAIRKKLYAGKDHPNLATNLNNVGTLLQAMRRSEEALPFYKDALQMRKRLYKDQDHPDLANSLDCMGISFRMRGRLEEALPFCKDALQMHKRLYKDQDHPVLAESLNSMGLLLKEMGRLEEALPFYKDALRMRKRLCKDQDHPYLAQSLNNMGYLLQAMERLEEALPFFNDALRMRKRLYKGRDHPDLALSLNNIGHLRRKMGRMGEALPFFNDALEMYRRLHKDQDHPDLAGCLNNMGYLLWAMGRMEEALPFFKDALQMQRDLADRFAYSSGLADALTLVAQFTDSRSLFLSASERLTGSTDHHATVWTEKAALSRLFRTQRQFASLGDHPDLLTLRVAQRRLTGLLNTPVPSEGDPKRDRELAKLSEQIRTLEATLAKLLPGWTPAKRLKLGRLHAALSPQDVFVDLYRYYDRYVAFVATRQGSIRVELGEAAPIDEAIEGWRRDLVDGRESRFADQLRQTLWEPIAKHFPPDTRRIFISPDGDLGRLPFAALPNENPDSVLLERYAIATVESGPFLMEQLTREKSTNEDRGQLLIAGGIEYDPPGETVNIPWPFLKGSAREQKQVLDLWGKPTETMSQSGHTATTEWLVTHLPKARFAHLATHGEFKAEEYAREKIRLQKARDRSIASIGSGRSDTDGPSGLGVRNPLGYVGIVMARANAPSAKSVDRGIVAGTSIWPLDLTNLNLVVLSACETGLGQNTGSTGVANLQMAFHAAGCENVICSLWQVDDQATSALMAEFYRQLWKQKKSPIEALRTAQLYVYRNPEVAMNWTEVVKRGRAEEALRAPKKVAAELPDGGKRLLDEPTVKTPLPERTPARYWAGFVLSGIGH